MALTRRSGAAVFVAHCCARARAAGVRAGMTLAQAQAIAPGLRAMEDDPARDRELLRRLAAWATRFTPVVEPVEPDTLLLNISGCAAVFGGEDRIGRLALDDLAAMGIAARAATADTVGGACALATASNEVFVIAPPGQMVAYIAKLPPAALRIDAQTAERLWSLGVRSIGDLLSLPRGGLAARFGAGLLRRLQQALGERPEPITAFRDDPPACETITFDGPLRDQATLQTAVRGLFDRVLADLIRRNESPRRLDLTIRFERPMEWECSIRDEVGRRRITPPAHISIGLSRASRSARHIGDLLASRVEKVDLAAGVCGVTLTAVQTSPWRAVTGNLFDAALSRGGPGIESSRSGSSSSAASDSDAVAELIDRIANRLGHAAVLRPMLVDDHQPEMAFRYVLVSEAGLDTDWKPAGTSALSNFGFWILDFGLSPDRPSIQNPKSKIQNSPGSSICYSPFDIRYSGPRTQRGHGGPTLLGPARPLRLLAPPAPIRVMAIVPDGPPARMVWRGREHELLHASGPERIETGWWRGPDVRRDYFRVTSHTGEHFWIFRALNENRWYLHGVFA